jgi:hypothetical protein
MVLLATWKLGFEKGYDMVMKVMTFMVGGSFLLELAKNRFLGIDD